MTALPIPHPGTLPMPEPLHRYSDDTLPAKFIAWLHRRTGLDVGQQSQKRLAELLEIWKSENSVQTV